jgi:soluble P-type ATPase
VHVLTADAFGRAAAELTGLASQLTVVPSGNEAEAKLQYVEGLTAKRVVAIGNGRNDIPRCRVC